MLEHIACKGKPVILATGASDIGEVQRAVHPILAINPQLVLMQCNTSYTASLENFDHIHLRVLNPYGVLFPECHPGPLRPYSRARHGAGRGRSGSAWSKNISPTTTAARGPDHPFSMTPKTWRRDGGPPRELGAPGIAG